MSDDKPTSNTETAQSDGLEYYDGIHFGDVLASWGNGVQLDVRVKLAVDFLKSGMFARPGEWMHVLTGQPIPPEGCGVVLARQVALFALEVSSKLLDLAMARGLLKQLPDTDELSVPHKTHLARAARANIYPQTQMARLAEEEGADRRVAQVAPGTRLPPA